MCAGEEAILRQIAVPTHERKSARNLQVDHLRIKVRHHLLRTGCIPPIPHQLARHGKHGENLNTSRTHAVNSFLRGLLIKRAGRVAVSEHGVAFRAEGQSEERGADLTKS